MLLARDFLPKRPTRASALAAAPLLGLALAHLLALAVPGPAGEGWLMTTMTMEFLLLWALFLLGGFAAANAGLVRYLLVGWYAFVFLALAALVAFATRDPAPFVAFALVLGGKGRTFFAKDKLLEREMLWIRSLLGIVVGYALLLPAGLLAQDHGVAAWGALYFTLAGAMELCRVLVPEPLRPS